MISTKLWPEYVPVVELGWPNLGWYVHLAMVDLSPCWSLAKPGDAIHVVAKCVVFDAHDARHLLKAIPGDQQFWFEGQIPYGVHTCTIIGGVFLEASTLPLVGLNDDTKILSHDEPTWETMRALVEVCSGMGCMGFGAIAAGFKPVLGVDFNPSMAKLYTATHGIESVVADVCMPETAALIWDKFPHSACLGAGISCQPYSRLGDQMGDLDARAQSLVGTLRTAHLIRSVVIVLECVEPAGTHPWVKHQLASFCQQTGFALREVVLHLHTQWPAKRSRWWAILSAPSIGPIDVFENVAWQDLTQVQQIIPSISLWHEEDEEALALNEEEQKAFQVHDSPKYMLNFGGLCPCALHAWGSQLHPCPCGCRMSRLAEARIQEKGLYGVVVQSALESPTGPVYRHLHPSECAGLCGMDPTIDWGEPKLALSALGQLASPLQANWVFATVGAHLNRMQFGQICRSPPEQLYAFRTWLLSRCRQVWPAGPGTKSTASLDESLAAWEPLTELTMQQILALECFNQLDECSTLALVLEHAKTQLQEQAQLCSIPQSASNMSIVHSLQTPEVPIQVRHHDTQIHDFLRAEAKLLSLAEEDFRCVLNGVQVDRKTQVANDSCVSFIGTDLDPTQATVAALRDEDFVHSEQLEKQLAVELGTNPVDAVVRGESELLPRMLSNVLTHLPMTDAVHAKPPEVPFTSLGPTRDVVPSWKEEALAIPATSATPKFELERQLGVELGSTPVLDTVPGESELLPRMLSQVHTHLPMTEPVLAMPSEVPITPLGPARDVVPSWTKEAMELSDVCPATQVDVETDEAPPASGADATGPVEDDVLLPPIEDPIHAKPEDERPVIPGPSHVATDIAQAPPGKRQKVCVAIGSQVGSSHAIVELSSEVLLRLKPSLPITIDHYQALRTQTILSNDRLTILSNQGRVWADDEILWHLNGTLAAYAAHWQHTQPPGPYGPLLTIDPLLISGWLQHPAQMVHWLQHNWQPQYAVITVAWIQGHWIPVLLKQQGQRLRFETWDVPHANHEPLVQLLAKVAEHFGLALQIVRSHRLFANHTCGMFAIAFLQHQLLHVVLPEMDDMAVQAHEHLRHLFTEMIQQNGACLRPWAWGTGTHEQAIQGLIPVLRAQGVPDDQLEARAKAAIRAIGPAEILTAIAHKACWRQLKALGNNAHFQFMLPSEIAAKVASKANSKTMSKAQTGKKSKKIIEEPPSFALDPAKLLIAPGTFQANGNPIAQVPMSSVGPLTHGVVVTTALEAEPYLRNGTKVSSGPLALLILKGPGQTWTSALPQSEVVVPCQCVANNEPLLVDVTLVQLGEGFVEKAMDKKTIAVEALDVTTIKLVLYRDEIGEAWPQMVQAPIKYIQQQLPFLKLCRESGCTCAHWHNEEDVNASSAILDVWRRQYMRKTFKPEPAVSAEVYSVCLRIPACLLHRALKASGAGGIFVEPRTEDAKQVHEGYTVIWVPRMSRTDLNHLKQTNPVVIGLARVGDRMGLRAAASNAAKLHDVIRPGSVYLPSGPRMSFLMGPMPFGSERSHVAKAMKDLG